jgi:hypothetical protein
LLPRGTVDQTRIHHESLMMIERKARLRHYYSHRDGTSEQRLALVTCAWISGQTTQLPEGGSQLRLSRYELNDSAQPRLKACARAAPHLLEL